MGLALAACLAACSQPSFQSTTGKRYYESDLRGRWLVINYWATWCAPCITEIPELIALSERHDHILVFGVNFDQPQGKEAAKQIAKMKITFPVLKADPRHLYGASLPQVLPTTFLINPAGELDKVLVGPQTEASILAVIDGAER